MTRMLIAAALLAAAPAMAQDEPTEAAPAEDNDRAALEKELTDIQQKLAAAEQKALADPKVRQMQQELQAKVEAEVKRLDPKFDEKVEKLTSLQEQLLDAQQTGDEARQQKIVAEAMQLQGELEATQNKAMASEQIAAAIAAYEELVREKMKAAEPEVDKLIERGNAIVLELQGQT